MEVCWFYVVVVVCVFYLLLLGCLCFLFVVVGLFVLLLLVVLFLLLLGGVGGVNHRIKTRVGGSVSHYNTLQCINHLTQILLTLR